MITILGAGLIIIGGIAIGLHMLPLKFSRHWVWDNSWYLACIVMYVVCPWLYAALLIPDTLSVLKETWRDVGMIALFGLIQGTGGVAYIYGVSLIGISLGYSVMLSLITVFSVTVPLVVAHPEKITTVGGITLLAGAATMVVGTVLCGTAGGRRGQTADFVRSASPRPTRYLWAILVCLWSGFANSFFYFALEFQDSIRAVASGKYGIPDRLWPVLVFLPLYAGMFVVNSLYFLPKMVMNNTLRNYWEASNGLAKEYGLAVAIAVPWFVATVVLYPAGFTLLGPLGVSVGAGLFMGMMIVSSNILGLKTGEWKDSARAVLRMLYAGVAVILFAMVVFGLGNHFSLKE